MIKAIIIDDEEHAIRRLDSLLQEYCQQTICLIGIFQSVPEGIQAIKELQPNLVFLDVQIKDQTGFDLLKQFNEINFDVIFTTAYERYAVQAFKFSAVDYLLKPIDADDLMQAVQKLKGRLSSGGMFERIDMLFHNLKVIQGASKKISVPTINGLVFVQVSDIIHCKSDANYTILFLKGQQKLTVAKTLKEFEELLAEYNFFRVHHSHLINLAYIKSYNKGKGGFVTMSDHSEIEVSTRRKDDFLKKIAEN